MGAIMGPRGAVVLALAALAAGGVAMGQAQRPAGPDARPTRDLSRAKQSIVDYTRGVAAPAMDCAALKTADFSGAVKVLSADTANANGAPYCHLVGLIEGRIRFEVALPASWNRRLLQIGNGGVAGEAVPGRGDRETQRQTAVRDGFVFTANDMGHVAPASGDTVAWAQNNPEGVIDFGWRAHHLNNLWARRIAERYYGATVARAYYSGCSTGGRTGYAEAQRFPDDFDGILAGAPVYNLVKLSMVNTAASAVLARSGLTQEQYAGVGKLMLAQCDTLDGVKDGVISDPRLCKFDVRKDIPTCGQPGAPGPGLCLTPAQVAALASLQPDIVVGGKRVYPGKILSSENMGRYLPSPTQPLPASRETADMILRGMALYPRGGPYPQLKWQTVDLAKDFNRTAAAQAVLDSGNPDIAAFHARGGKMITYIGWEDTGVNPRTVMEYWDQVAGRLGTPGAMDTYRVFLVPGMGHCQGGAGAADYFDMLTPLIEWVEAGVAPQSVIGTKRGPDGATQFSRRFCPYPQSAHYLGGDASDAASYACVAPAKAATSPVPPKARKAG